MKGEAKVMRMDPLLAGMHILTVGNKSLRAFNKKQVDEDSEEEAEVEEASDDEAGGGADEQDSSDDSESSDEEEEENPLYEVEVDA
jgi:hypothetical protein